MKLVGMLDSPYVRRVAISLATLDIPFEHQALSVFSTFEAFRQLNPVVKAPTLITDDGTLLVDSTLILDHVDHIRPNGRSLMPRAPSERTQALRVLGLALAACDKTVQLVYERNLRPADRRYEPWLTRVAGQLDAALTLLEAEIRRVPPAIAPETIDQRGITVAVTWRCVRDLAPDRAPESAYPALVELSGCAEALPAFRAFPPDGPGVASDGLGAR